MGITHDSLNRLKPYLHSGISMLELGAQNLYDAEHYGWIAKDYFESLGIEHTSIDIIQHQKCLHRDLREPFDMGEFDLVTNFGTIEHVDGSLYQPLKNIHNACKVDGFMIHENPKTGNWRFHGHHYFQKGFWIDIAATCKYKLIESEEEAAMGNTTDGWNVCCVLRKEANSRFLTKKQFEDIRNKYFRVTDYVTVPNF